MSIVIIVYGVAISIVIIGVGQNYIHTVYTRYFWQGNHQIYGHLRCTYTVLPNRNYYAETIKA